MPDNPLIKGGQGRDEEDVRNAARMLAYSLFIALGYILVALLIWIF